jgi:hypothetical protein
MGDGATRELIFRSIYYMLENIVNLVWCLYFPICGHVLLRRILVIICYFGLRQFYIMNLSVIKCDVHVVQLIKLLFKFTHCVRNNRKPLISVAICIIAMNFMCCIIMSSIATNNYLLHEPSITTDSNSLQVTYIISKTSLLHYHIIYGHQPLFVASDLYYHQHKFVATYVYYLED